MTIETARVAITARPNEPFALSTAEIAPLRPDEVLVEITASGICHTDLMVIGGGFPTPFPIVLGHEGTGTVRAVGDAVSNLKPGSRVVLSFDFCGICAQCRSGHPSVCPEFFDRNFRGARKDGSTGLKVAGQSVHSHFLGQSAFATHAVVPQRCAVPVDTEMPDSTLAPFGCGIQSGAGAVLNALAPTADDSLAVFGLGSVGMAAVMAAAIIGCRQIVAIDPIAARRNLAIELGATHQIDPSLGDVVAEASRITDGIKFAVESSGAPGVLRQALDVLTTGGTVALVGSPPAGPSADTTINIFDLLASGKSIKSVLLGDGVPSEFIPVLIQHWKEGALPVERIVTTFPLDDIQTAVSAAHAGTVVKPVLIP